jgi:2-aminobenzoate-CoA ligase
MADSNRPACPTGLPIPLNAVTALGYHQAPFLRSGHEDGFARAHLPPRSQWPAMPQPPSGIGYPDRLNAAATLIDQALAAGRANSVALSGRGSNWTYAELSQKVDQIAHVLRSRYGLKNGHRVLLRGFNSPMLAACWLAVLKAGCIAVTTMPLLRARELSVIAERAQVNAALCEAGLSDALDDAFLQSVGPRPVLTYGDSPAEPSSLEREMSGFNGRFIAADTAQDDVAIIAFTSGTTGVPKGTMHFHRDILLIADLLSRHLLAPTPDDVFIGTPPLAFTFGLGGLLIFPLRVGARAVLEPQWTPESLLQGISDHAATICFTAPTFYRKMAPLASGQELTQLRVTVSSGEMLPADTREQWREATGLEMTECLGSTELLHAFIGCRPGEIRPGATGRIIPGYEACILDDQGRTLAPGEVGRLAVRGPTGCRYLDDSRQGQYVQHGWNLTGDAYLMDSDGYFWYQSRTDDMIISAGYNIAGPEVEDILLTHPGVAECGVVGAPDPDRGQIVMAFIVTRAGYTAGPGLTRELQDWVKERLAPYKYPRAIRYIEALPRTENAKLQRFKLREWAALRGTQP